MARILVVDDDPISLSLIGSALEKAGYEIRTAADGWQACLFLHEERFDALVTDEIMSVMNGQELCRFVKEQGKRIPIVMVTCLNEELDRAELRNELGIVAVLGKPLSPPLLLDVLDAHLYAGSTLQSAVDARELECP